MEYELTQQMNGEKRMNKKIQNDKYSLKVIVASAKHLWHVTWHNR